MVKKEPFGDGGGEIEQLETSANESLKPDENVFVRRNRPGLNAKVFITLS